MQQPSLHPRCILQLEYGPNTNPITVCPQVATNYNVTGTDGYGCSGTASKTINVDYPKPDFTASPNHVCIGNAINFVGESTCEGSIDSWLWQFGDGSAATGQNTYHYYYSSGTFHVTLTVADAYGNTYSKHDRIWISKPDHIVLSGVFNDCDASKIHYTIDNASIYDSYFHGKYLLAAEFSSIIIKPQLHHQAHLK